MQSRIIGRRHRPARSVCRTLASHVISIIPFHSGFVNIIIHIFAANLEATGRRDTENTPFRHLSLTTSRLGSMELALGECPHPAAVRFGSQVVISKAKNLAMH
jgi:hypothetical protein